MNLNPIIKTKKLPMLFILDSNKLLQQYWIIYFTFYCDVWI